MDLPTERFPRQFTIQFVEESDTELYVQMHLLDARPNAFPDGPITLPDGRRQGYLVDAPLGDPLRDLTYRAGGDGYRYHDAWHIAFAATLSWSPVMRSLLNIKRRSDPMVDRIEDGGRAVLIEESAAHFLGGTALSRSFDWANMNADFMGQMMQEQHRVVTPSGRSFRTTQWTHAIRTGARLFELLHSNRGGIVTADLDDQSVDYTPDCK